MDATPSSSTQTAFAAEEPVKRLLDPFAEWRDYANQWDVTEVWGKRGEAPSSGPAEQADVRPPATAP